MKLWFHDHLVDEVTDLVANHLDEKPQTVAEYQAVRDLYEERSSFDLLVMKNDMEWEKKFDQC